MVMAEMGAQGQIMEEQVEAYRVYSLAPLQLWRMHLSLREEAVVVQETQQG